MIAAANTEAYDAYLVGRAFVNARTPGWEDKAIAAFEKAIRLDENYAPPYAGLAVALSINNPDWDAVRESAVRAAKTAIELDPELAEGHAALGLILIDLQLFWRYGKRTRARRTVVAAGSGARPIALDWPTAGWRLLCGNRVVSKNREPVQEQGLLVDPLNPVLSWEYG